MNVAEMACYSFKALPDHVFSKSHKKIIVLVEGCDAQGRNYTLLLLLLLLLLWLAFQNEILRWPDGSAIEVHRGHIQRCKKNMPSEYDP